MMKALLAGLTLSLAMAACSPAGESPYRSWTPAEEFSAPEDGYVTVAQEDGSSLSVNPATMDIRYSSGGALWESLPFSQEDPGDKSADYSSLFTIRGVTLGGDEFLLDSWSYCISGKQYEVKIENGRLTGVFTVGEIVTRVIVPDIIRASAFEEQILNQLDESARRRFERRYRRITLSEIEDETEKKELLRTYPILSEEDLYLLLGLTAREKKQLETNAKEAGYTEEMMDAEYAALGYEDQAAERKPLFQITMILSLEQGDLVAEIPEGSVLYDTGSYVLKRIDFLKNLTSSKTGEAKSIFFPDGSGAIIDLTRMKNRSGNIAKPVYGGDDFIDRPDQDATVSLPVFGFTREGAAMFAVVEDGDAMTEITANYNALTQGVFPSFVHQASNTRSIEDGARSILLNNYNPIPYAGAYKVRYMLPGASADYPEMAACYRGYLIEKGILEKGAAPGYPLYLETLGSVRTQGNILFVPVRRDVALTTFDQNIRILRTLREQGIPEVCLKLTGALNGGLLNRINSAAEPEKVLGGGKKLRELIAFALEAGYEIYPNAEFARVYRDGWLDGFTPRTDSARNVEGQYSMASVLNLATGEGLEDSLAYRLSASELPAVAARFLKKSAALDNTGLSVGALGEQLSPNYTRGRVTNRQQAKQRTQEALSLLAGRGPGGKLMAGGGNLYVLPYAKQLVNVPVTSSEYLDYAQTVPFLQMVYHGSVSYASPPLNLTEDYRYAFLKAVETGSGISFTLAAQNTGELRSTPFSFYLAADSEYWLPVAAEAYQKARGALLNVADQVMVGHRQLQTGVYETTYENGKQIIVNYSRSEFTDEGLTVPPMDFAHRIRSAH